jgi:parvulin-like peptidyl-prolyl isomerase
MVLARRPGLVILLFGLWCGPTLAQETLPAPAPPPSSPPVQIPTGTAATVNGQAIPEKAVFRSLRQVPAEKRADARNEILNYLIDNVVIDQAMVRASITVSPKDIDARMSVIRSEIKKEGKEFDKVMRDLLVTEEDFRAQIAADLRWDKFAGSRATDNALRDLFKRHPAIFNGSMVHARHILLPPAAEGKEALDQVKVRMALIKKQIEDKVGQGLVKLDPNTDNLKREMERTRLLEAAFAEAATSESKCPSAKQGGDIGWFPRAGKMVETFAEAAFALKPYQLSDIVTTPFGCHLILVMEVKAGQNLKYEDIKDVVRDVFSDRLRDETLARLRPAARIVINPAPKP